MFSYDVIYKLLDPYQIACKFLYFSSFFQYFLSINKLFELFKVYYLIPLVKCMT